jgi:hypothetical protein
VSCIFWACLYLSAGLADMAVHPSSPPGSYLIYDINQVRSPYGVAELGWSRALGKWDFEAAARHMSSLAVDAHYGDFSHQYGINTFEVRARWFPFR